MSDKIRIALIQGSPRRAENCPDQWGKTKLLSDFIIKNCDTSVEIDSIDLSVPSDGNIIQPCKGCVSTSSFHCHYPCDCYVADSKTIPDFMHNEQIYSRLEACDGFLILTPVHWYAPTSVVKSFFDRLVCVNLTITAEQAIKLGLGKDAQKTRAVEKGGEWNHLLRNHYAGKYAAFFIHGDAGGVDYSEFVESETDGWHPKMPRSLADYLKSESEGWVNDPTNSIMPIVWQCRYSGIYVPDDLICGFHATEGVGYAEAMDLAETNLKQFYLRGLALLNKLVSYLRTN